ncbi:Gfo/Idh/MocA family protein [Streptomyces sp. CA-249302]|uniref:Gfo/Idh/MocA family protein n=1 Tax=Streptomyces sp. CA-249302 TaxID=3240058 RepID=UPI003D8AF3ED
MRRTTAWRAVPGRLEQLIVIIRDPASAPAEYLRTPVGLFRDMTTHDPDMARFLLVEVVEVSAVGSSLVAACIPAPGAVGGALVTLRGADGAPAHITHGRRCTSGYDRRLEALGALGTLSVGNLPPDGAR